MIHDRRLAEAALEAGYVTLADLRTLVPQARRDGEPLSALLLAHGLSAETITFLQACALSLPYVQADRVRTKPRIRAAIPYDVQRKYCVVPLRCEADAGRYQVFTAMLPEVAAELSRFLTETLRAEILPVAASATSITRALAGDIDPQAQPAEALELELPANPHTRSATAESHTTKNATPDEDMQITSLADF